MQTRWNGRYFEMTAEPGEYLTAVECHERWIAEQLKPAVRRRQLAKFCTGAEKRELELKAIECELTVEVSRQNLNRLASRQDSSRGEFRLLAEMPTAEKQKNRIRELERLESSMHALNGYAAVFYSSSDSGTEYQLGPHLIERIERGAFRDTLSERRDIRALWSHDQLQPLGSTKAGTLALFEDSTGLRFELQPDLNTTYGSNLLSMVRRKDVRGCSFGMKVVAQKMSREFGNDIRTITRVHLLEISPCVFPAYESAFIQ